MQIKHTFLFLFILGFASMLLAFQTGPDPAVNGILAPNQNAITAAFTCAMSGCHNSFGLNSNGTNVTLNGLPAEWTPGQTYTLTVNVSQAATVYGFELSAVFDTTNAQAGTLTRTAADSSRTKIITGSVGAGGVVQFAEHSFAGTNPTFTVNWTAPATASGGAVRFNLAGNAANGNFNSDGDRIYARVDRRSPSVAVTPTLTSITTTPAAPAANQNFSFTLAGTNFDASNAIAVFTGPGCSPGCPGDVSSRTATQITGTATLQSGTFSVTVQNGAGGAASNTVALAVSAIPFNLTDRQSLSVTSDGSGALGVGYARIQPNAGSTTPSGVAIFGLRQNNILVTEAGVPASPLITSGRLFAEVFGVQGTAGAVNTGFAIANPNSSTATVNFSFTNAAGVDTAVNQFTIPPNTQTVKFLNEAPFNSGLTFQGTFSFSSNVPVSVIAVRGYYNERIVPRSEFLLTTLPVVDLSAGATSGNVVLAHFADGGTAADGIWTTQIDLVNPTGNTLTGSIQFFGQGTETVAAGPISLTAGGQTSNSFSYSIPGRSSFKLVTAGASATVQVGSVRINPSGGTASPTAVAVFSFKRQGITVSEAGVPGVSPSTAFRMYVEASATARTNSGIALTSTSTSTTAYALDLYDLDGDFVANASLAVGGNGQAAQFLDQFFPGITLPFKGVLVISGPSMSVVSLRSRYNERNDFLITTTPATNETGSPSGGERLFPHLVNGSSGGDLYTTQFILFSGTSGQASDGALRFFDAPTGSGLGLSVN